VETESSLASFLNGQRGASPIEVVKANPVAGDGLMKRTALCSRKAFIRGVVLMLFLSHAAIAAPGAVMYSNPVLAGDYPDPSVIRVGRGYWATATPSDWAPLFPLLHSNDLVNWNQLGNVFPKPPEWSMGNYWAPEISAHENRYYVYYVARKIGGPLAVAVATAPRPEGPYTDHGPLLAQEAGSIDPTTATDENGKRFLIWKEDGNSRKLPTSIWAQELSPDGTRLEGEMKELIRNDAPWEGQVVEGPFVLRRNDWFYLFYSGNACCGLDCNYALGVARSKTLLGPWEKNPGNPILAGNQTWKCPGHGSVVTDPQGRDFLLYHAYHTEDSVYVGRQALLDEIKWETNGWPTINQGRGPSRQAPAPHGYASHNGELFFTDEFKSGKLAPNWQWPQYNEPKVQLKSEHLELAPTARHANELVGAVLAIRSTRTDYEAVTLVNLSGMKPGLFAGLAAYGDQDNAAGIAAGNGSVIVWRRQKKQQETLATDALREGNRIYLRLNATSGRLFRFATSSDGRQWKDRGSGIDLEGDYLPPWDRGVRVALNAGGAEDAPARFDWFRLYPVRK